MTNMRECSDSDKGPLRCDRGTCTCSEGAEQCGGTKTNYQMNKMVYESVE